MHGKNESACMRVWRELDRLYAAHSDALLIDCGDDLAVEVQERAKGKRKLSREWAQDTKFERVQLFCL